MREYDDHIRHYTPVLQRIIILVAVIVAVPVVLWTITAFVRSYVGPPKVPTFQRMMTAGLAPADDSSAADAPLPGTAEAHATATDVRTTLLEIRKPADQPQAAIAPAPATPRAAPAATAAPPAPAQQAASPPAQPAPSPAPAAPQIAIVMAPANTAPAGADKADRVALQAAPATNTPTGTPTPAASTTVAAAPKPDLAWPNPPPLPPPAPDASADGGPALASQEGSPSDGTAAADALPAAPPIVGRVPLPRRRPTLYAMAQSGGSGAVPMPRPRPQTAGPAVSDTPAGPLDWLGKLFQPQPQNSPQNP